MILWVLRIDVLGTKLMPPALLFKKRVFHKFDVFPLKDFSALKKRTITKNSAQSDSNKVGLQPVGVSGWWSSDSENYANKRHVLPWSGHWLVLLCSLVSFFTRRYQIDVSSKVLTKLFSGYHELSTKIGGRLQLWLSRLRFSWFHYFTVYNCLLFVTAVFAIYQERSPGAANPIQFNDVFSAFTLFLFRWLSNLKMKKKNI